jgi:hypothetical protein
MDITQIQQFGPSIVTMRFDISYADTQNTTGYNAQGTNPPLVVSTLSNGNKTATLNLFTLPLGTLVLAYRIKPAVAFTGGGETAVTCSLGSAAGSATTFGAAFNIFQAVADTTFAAAAASALMATYAADTLQAVITSTTNALSGLTAGEVYVDVMMLVWTNLVGSGPVGNAPFSTTGGGYYGS